MGKMMVAITKKKVELEMMAMTIAGTTKTTKVSTKFLHMNKQKLKSVE